MLSARQALLGGPSVMQRTSAAVTATGRRAAYPVVGRGGQGRGRRPATGRLQADVVSTAAPDCPPSWDRHHRLRVCVWTDAVGCRQRSGPTFGRLPCLSPSRQRRQRQRRRRRQSGGRHGDWRRPRMPRHPRSERPACYLHTWAPLRIRGRTNRLVLRGGSQAGVVVKNDDG